MLLAATAAQAGAQATTIGTIGLTPGWATFGQALPEGVATGGLQVGSFPTQTDVKNRWPDGSIKFAIVTVFVPTSGNYLLKPAPAAPGSFTPALPAASVSLVIGGTTYTATLPATPAADAWLSGPLVSEARSVIAPVSGAAPHPFLRVNFDTRVYNDGQARVDVSVENVLDKAGATTVTYNVDVVVNGQSVFSKPAVEHYYLTRWRKTFQVGAQPLSSITPDIVPFNQSGALPPYLSFITNIVYQPAGPNYEILQAGALEKNMPAHSGRPEIAPYPNWTARYLIHKNLTQRAFVLANGDLSGSWPIHVREAEGSAAALGAERLISLNQRPNIWYDERAQSNGWDFLKGSPLPIREYGTLTPGPGQTALIPDNAHQPSLAYVPYLMTGDRYYAEEMAFWANYGMLRTYPGDGTRGSTGVIANNEIRGFGWALRNLVDAAAYYPDASPVKTYLSEKVMNNLQWVDDYITRLDPVTNPFQVLWVQRRPDGPQYISLWEQTYLAHAIDRANRQGFIGGMSHRDAIARFQLRLFTSEPDYPRLQGAPYIVGVGVPGASGLVKDFVYHTTMAQIWASTAGQERPFAGFYGPEARMNLIRAVEQGWPGAQQAYDFLWPFIGATNSFCPDDGSTNTADLACRAGWALDFSGNTAPAPLPAQITNPAPGSKLASGSQIFNWNTGVGITSYMLAIGTSLGANDIYSGPEVTSLSALVTGLPTDGSDLWVRLSSSIGGVWQHVDYTFTAAGGGGPGPAQFGISNIVVADGAEAQTTAPFNTAAGDLLVAFVSSSGPSEGGQTMTVSGGGLSWTLAVRENGELGASEIWTAPTPTAQTGITVTSTPGSGAPWQSLVVLTISRAAGVGAVAHANAPGGGPSVTLTPTSAGSLVFAVGNDWNGSVPRVLGPNQSMVHEFFFPGNDTFWVQRLDGTVAAAGTPVTLNATEPTDHIWNFAAIEIVPFNDAPPVVTWINPADIAYGTPLGATQLSATANVPGTFLYNPAAGTVLSAGNNQTLSTTFTPANTAYGPVTASVLLNVLKATPTITWNAPANIVTGTALGAGQLNATADVPGTFVYNPPAGTILPTGAGQTLSVTFTPNDLANYTTTTAAVAITVGAKPTPTITWAAPANIVVGTALGAAQLNATASVPGTFVYTPPAGTVLPLGPAQPLSVTFTPTDTAGFTTATAMVPITVVSASGPGPATSPVTIGSGISGNFNDPTGHSGQSHLVYAPNAGVWWFFTLTSTSDAVGNRQVKAYRSSGPNLATATWSASTSSPNLDNAGGATNSLLAGGRSLGVALHTVGGVDYVHVFASAAFDGQVSSNGHIRAQLGGTSITWGAWNNPGSPNAASEWQGPPATDASNPGASAGRAAWGNSIGISTGGYIHHFSVTMDQEVDCNIGRSTNPDVAATWTNGFGNNVSPTGRVGTSPPWTVAVIDKTMTNECKVLSFAPLASDFMLAVYSNGALAQPNLSNLRFQKSGAAGTWTNISGSTGGGNGNVFGSNANINQNDWALVPVTTTRIYAFRRTATGNAIQGASYQAGPNNWVAMTGALAPPAFESGQAFKSGAGLFGATDGTNVWLFFVNTDAANSILYSKFDGASWTPWATVPGTGSGTQTRSFIAGYPTVGNGQVGLVWTQGTANPYSVVTTSFSVSGGAPAATVSLTAPLSGSTLTDTVTVSADATPGGGTIDRVQFVLDGVNLGAEDTTFPYEVSWDTLGASNGTHFLSAVARDTNGGTGTASTITVTVRNDVTPPTVVMTAPPDGQTVLGTAVGLSADATDDIGVVGVQFLLDGAPLGAERAIPPYTITWDSTTASPGPHTLAARARDAFGRQTTSAPLNITVQARTTPAITWPAPADIVYGTALGAAQLNATTNVTGTFVYTPPAGTVLSAGGPHTLSVTFTPDDTASYTSATATVSITVLKAMPVLTWSAPLAIQYGTALGATQLNATASVPGTFVYTPASGTVLAAGVSQPLSVTFTPTDSANYSIAVRNVAITVFKTTPVVAWAAPAQISYGTALGGAQLNATAIVAGTFVYAPPAGTILDAGPNQALSVTFTPADDANYTTAVATVQITVGKGTPALTWSTPADIAYGTALGPLQLNAASTVPGTFDYTPAAGTVLAVGAAQVLSVVFTPSDLANYTSGLANVAINVLKATPAITWPAPADIAYGTALGAAQLNATTTVDGTFVYTPAAGTVLNAGAAQTLSLTFTPDDPASYNSATATAEITVLKASPAIEWPAPAAITYGTVLGAAQLNATSEVAGSFEYSPAVGAVLDAGARTLAATFTPEDESNYNSQTASVDITVLKATPTITWPAPADIVYGTALGAAQLNATASIPGTFEYTPAAGTLLNAGAAQTLSVTFRPTDAENYDAATATVTISVNRATPTIVWPSPGELIQGTPLGSAQLNASSDVPGTFEYTPSAGTVLPVGAAQTLSATFTPADQNYSVATASIVVSVVSTTPTISLSATTATVGSPITVTVANGPANLDDWVALVPVGADSTAYVDYRFLNGLKSVPIVPLRGGIFTFPMPIAPGAYHLRLLAKHTYNQLLATSATITVVAPSVAVSAASAPVGATVTVTVTNGPGKPADWVALVPVGAPAQSYVDYRYLNGLKVVPAAGASSASLTFTTPVTPGAYEFRMFANNSYTLLATSAPMTVSRPTLGLSATTITSGASLTVTVANGPAKPADWVALVPAGAPLSAYVDYQYLNGTRMVPLAGTSNATLTFRMPAAAGEYNLQFFSNNSYTVLATSSTLTVAAPLVTVSSTTARVATAVTVAVANAPGNLADWVTLVPVGAPSSAYVDYRFMNGLKSEPATAISDATLTFNMPLAPGAYEMRLLANHTYTVLATSATIIVPEPTISVSESAAAPGSQVTVTVSNGPGKPADWVALVPAGAASQAYVDYRYMNGKKVVPAAGVSDATLTFTMPTTPGSYELRMFLNNTYTSVTVGPTIVVQ
jgi:hypothetical protein